MPLFLSDEEYARCSHDPSLIAQKADAYIRELYNQLETEKAEYDASSITAEQTCSMLEQKYVSLKSEFATLQSEHSLLNSSLQERVSEVARIQADKHQIYLQSIGKDGEIERLSLEASELQKSKSQLLQLIEHKDLEINEKNSSIKGYLDKIVALTDNTSSKESRISELEADHARVHTSLARLTQEKELVERHNLWLNDELTTKVNSFLELRKVHNELEADMSSKLADLERKYNETLNSLKWKDDRVQELELKLESLQNEMFSCKGSAAATEERLSAELSTVSKLVELYKENSDEWSKKAGELEGVIKALETHANQVEKDYKEKLDNETSARIEFEKQVSNLKEKLEKCEAELEKSRNSDQINLLQMSSYNTNAKSYDNNNNNDLMIVPSIPAGISGTALAASLLRDGWSLVKMYEKYQEAVDALQHEQLGRKHSQSILEHVLHEIEEKTEAILDERAEHERMVESYDILNEKLQNSLSEQTGLESTIQELKAELKRHERDYNLSQKEITDLQKQVTILLKECRDLQIRGGGGSVDFVDQSIVVSDADNVFSDRLLTFKDINGLVEQNVQLRGLVRLFTEQIETKEAELTENFEKEFQKHNNETASKVGAVLARAEEQAQMIESLHTSVAMYKKLYEEEHKINNPSSDTRNNVPMLLEGSNDALKRAEEKAYEHVKLLEEDITGLKGEIFTLRSENSKLSLEVTFAREKLDRFMKDFDHQREETNGIISRNVELSQLIVDYQKKIREASENLEIAEDLSRKLNMEVSILKREKEILINSEKRAFEEVKIMSERVYQLQATLNTIQTTEEAREESRSAQKTGQEDYVKRAETERAEAKQELQEERDNVRKLTLEHESAMRGSMIRIEEMGKELSNALRAVSDANARASAAEERLTHFEKTKPFQVNDENTPKDDAVALKEEIEKLRAEAQYNKDHMLQYRSLANVNETALKQMEESHENFKSEAEKVKKILEDEIESLKQELEQLQNGYNLKVKEAESAAISQQEAVASSLSEISKLKEDSTSKMLQIVSLESQMSAMKDDLEKEHKKWRIAQDNYERQVILQSETIQELTKTSQELSKLQEKMSDLEKMSNILKIENNELRSKRETEKKVLEEARDKAEKKYNEINEQNKLLHDQLEALHIKMAGGPTSDDGGLENVVKYLRRSKEIAESEISLLKQEKLRLQSQLEAAVNAESAAQSLVRAEREKSQSVRFTEDEFKALQVQVREMNLLRESNVQLREENKHNFEECLKLREFTHTAKSEVEKLENSVGEKEREVEACERQIEIQKTEIKDLEIKVNDLLHRFKDIDPEEYVRMRENVGQMNVKLLEKDGQLEEVKKVVSEKQEAIQRLENDLAKSKGEVDERESKVKSVVQSEASLKLEVDRHKRLFFQLKRRYENLGKEKEDLVKKNLELSKELADSNTVKKSGADDTRIQLLEKTVENLREELGEKEAKDKRIQMLEKIIERLRNEKAKVQPPDEVEKMKNATESEAPVPNSGDTVDDVVATAPVAATSEVVPVARNMEDSAKRPVALRPKVETRKMSRKLVRPRIVKPDQPKGDVNMTETSGGNVQSSLRKRPSSSASEGEGSHVRESTVSDVAAPLVKKSKGPEQPQEGGDSQNVLLTSDAPEDENQTMKEDEEVETGDGDGDGDEVAVDDQTEPIETEDPPKVSEGEVPATGENENENEAEEGEVITDANAGNEDGNQETEESQQVDLWIRSPSPMPVEDDETLGYMEVNSPLEENEDKNEEGEIEADETTPESSADKNVNDEAGPTVEETATDHIPANATTGGVSVTPVTEKPGEASVASQDVEVKAEEAVADPITTTISLRERARERSLQRLAGTQPSPAVPQPPPPSPPVAPPQPRQQPPPAVARGRGRVLRGRIGRGGRTARGGQSQTPGSQGGL